MSVNGGCIRAMRRGAAGGRVITAPSTKLASRHFHTLRQSAHRSCRDQSTAPSLFSDSTAGRSPTRLRVAVGRLPFPSAPYQLMSSAASSVVAMAPPAVANTPVDDIPVKIAAVRKYFQSHATKAAKWRKDQVRAGRGPGGEGMDGGVGRLECTSNTRRLTPWRLRCCSLRQCHSAPRLPSSDGGE
jgi:hypothetical protein